MPKTISIEKLEYKKAHYIDDLVGKKYKVITLNDTDGLRRIDNLQLPITVTVVENEEDDFLEFVAKEYPLPFYIEDGATLEELPATLDLSQFYKGEF